MGELGHADHGACVMLLDLCLSATLSADKDRHETETDMTERTIQVSMTLHMAELLQAQIEDQLNQEPSKETKEALYRAHETTATARHGLSLMNKATKLYEDDRIALFEHPTYGDEAPVMAYVKETEEFIEDTKEWDGDESAANWILEAHRNEDIHL